MNSICILIVMARAMGKKTHQTHEVRSWQRAGIDVSSDELITMDSNVEPCTGIEIHNEFGRWVLTNRSTSTSVAVNGQPMRSNGFRNLARGDVLEIGVYRFEIDTALIDGAEPLPTTDMRGGLDGSPFDIIPAADIHHDRPASPDGTDDGSQDVLAVLAREYRLALTDSSRAQHFSGGGVSKDVFFVSSATPEELAEAHNHRTLREIVVGPERIDGLIVRLGDLDAAHLLEPSPEADVLRLFAPPYLHLQRDGIQPAITRRDHQSVGIDSHYRMPASSEATPS